MLPSSDSTYIEYEKFKNIFGEDGNVLFIGLKDTNLFDIDVFSDWYDLNYRLKDIDGVNEVISIARVFYLNKNSQKKKFDFVPLISRKPASQRELDSLIFKLYSLPIYDGLLYDKGSSANLMMVTLQNEKLNTKERIKFIENIKFKAESFGKKHNIKLHYSGLPYIRTITTKKVRSELKLFVILAMLIASIALFLFFRSFKAVLFPMIIVVIALVWVMGMIELLGYEITILSGIIPPLLIVIVVENCIFLLIVL